MQKIIYFIDDDENIRSLVSLMLSPLFRFKSFEDPYSALSYIDQDILPHLIITDFRMPEMSGIKFIKELYKRKIEVPCIILSGAADKEMALDALRLGVKAIIEKPIDKDMLLKVINDVLEKNESSDIANIIIGGLKSG